MVRAVQMVQKKAQFDDRIRNLLALAEDNSVESRTLLFSHICDLFIQKRKMESENQVRMLIDIINELINDVDISIRKELCSILLNMDYPPDELIKLISEDVIDVAGELLEQAIIDEEQLLYLIKYASNDHRAYIGRRFGLSPLLRRELEEVNNQFLNSQVDTKSDNVKTSLSELEEAEQNSTELNEDTTANILELLKANKSSVTPEISLIHPKDEMIISEPEIKADQLPSLTSKILLVEDEKEKTPNDISEKQDEVVIETVHKTVINLRDEPIEEDVIGESTASNLSEPDKSQQIQKEWFWEIDRYGNINYLSENTEDVFTSSLESMIGEDFLCLWTGPDDTDDTDDEINSFISVFEKRLPFRNLPYDISTPSGEGRQYLLSGIATFDVDTGRFTGFRGSCQSTTQVSAPGAGTTLNLNLPKDRLKYGE